MNPARAEQILHNQAEIIRQALTQPGTPAQYAVQCTVRRWDKGEVILHVEGVPGMIETYIEWYDNKYMVVTETNLGKVHMKSTDKARTATRILIDRVHRVHNEMEG